MLEGLGLPKELIDKIKDSSNPSINNHAEGGKGGHSISLTYVDNYSSLLLVYTFLLYTTHNSPKNNNMLNEALLSTLKTSLKEQQEYRLAFLNAVNSLNQK
jgi:hypothetical protein